MSDFCKLGLAVTETEAQAIFDLSQKIDKNFDAACRLILAASEGRVILTGMGKSGHIGRKIASTFASLGTPAFFVHPAEATHGDLGMITKKDILIIISYSGNTPEILSLLPSIIRLNVPIIALTGNLESPLAKSATVTLHIGVGKEACPFGLAPTTSTTVTLVMGDALAIALLNSKGFTKEDFANSHPGGNLGKKLLLKIDQIWQTGEAIPKVKAATCIKDALEEVTAKRLGMTCVVNHNDELVGVYTDGDIRRTLNKQVDIHKTPIAEVMTVNCKTTQPGTLAAEALSVMQTNKITSLIVVDDKKSIQAIVHLHDLLRAGVI
ncbi:MAG: D-arabinose 5-phosphate isomerase [Legionellales bacterium RIFCSPHIGHO2_12_FULL_37_14]|nr:MAG: D-arabinose 5-phosphate isomerase [Legionellales bacterium RIFCSPHIGHO2_12_FULL_37_14]